MVWVIAFVPEPVLLKPDTDLYRCNLLRMVQVYITTKVICLLL